MRRTPGKNTCAREWELDEAPVEADLVYWLEHVVHWHALLVAVITALAIGYIFFNQDAVLAR